MSHYSLPLLAGLSLLAIGGVAQAAPEAPPPDEGGGFAVEDVAPEEGGNDGFAVDDSEEISDEDLEDVETIQPVAEGDPDAAPVPEDDGDFTFEVVDLTEDEEALAKELEVDNVEVKGAKGTLKGTVKDSVTGEPLIGAFVEAIGTKYKTKAGADGSYEMDLPPGTYEIRIRYDTSQPLRVSNIVVDNGGATTLSRDLVPLEGAGETVAVQAEMNKESEGARLLQRKESAAARDLMSRDEIAKSGGGSTSAVARRIVGTTVVGGRFLFVRGLGHRYGNTLFDGARVPSPEPELRTVPLDIFPSGALSAINIQKTFTPDVPADFTGGSTQLESRDVPDEFFLEVGADIGANTATTGRKMVTGGGFLGPDAFGFGNIPRALPGEIPDQLVQRNSYDDNGQRLFSDEQLERFGESMLTDTRIRKGAVAPPNFGAKATAGYGTNYGGGGKVGFLVSSEYKNQHSTLHEVIRRFIGGDGVLDVATPQVDYRGFKTTYRTTWSSIGLLKWRANKRHRFSALGLYSRDAEDETRELRGVALSVSGAPVINTRNRYIARSIAMTRFGGKHKFPKAKDLEVDWFGSYAQARRDDPSMRDMLFAENTTGAVAIDPTNGGGKLLFLELLDHTESGAANVTLPFKQWKKLKSRVKTGVWVEGKQREFSGRRFAYQPVAGFELPSGTGNIFNPSTIGGGSPNGTAPFFLNETTRAQDNYRATQEVYATYAMLDLPIVRWFKLSGGLRFEASDIAVDPFDPYDTGAELESAEVKDRDVLPVASVIFSPKDNMNIRLGGTRTLARPEFRELAPFEFADFVGAFNVRGNPALVSTKVWNADLRWEWFPSASEVVAVSVFYKDFDKPIERVVLPRVNGLASFANAKGATNIGAEFEVRKSLEFIGKPLRGFSFGANFAYIYSRVRLNDRCDPDTDPTCDPMLDVSTSRSRPLQGQSPFVVNTYLDYTNEDSGTSGRFMYNSFGRRIDQVAGLSLPDIYEEPIHNFDFVVGQEIFKDFQLSFSVENLLNWPRRFTQGPNRDITYLAWPGASIKLGASYKF